MMNTTRTLLAVSLVALTTSGCMVGPDYQRPQVAVPATWHELPGWTEAQPAAAEGPKGDWWTVFDDPLLNELEPQVAVSNQTVRQSYANYQQAIAEVRIARVSDPCTPIVGNRLARAMRTSAMACW